MPYSGSLVPLSRISGDMSSGFQSYSGFCLRSIYFCRGRYNVHSLDSPLMLHLPTSWCQQGIQLLPDMCVSAKVGIGSDQTGNHPDRRQMRYYCGSDPAKVNYYCEAIADDVWWFLLSTDVMFIRGALYFYCNINIGPWAGGKWIGKEEVTMLGHSRYLIVYCEAIGYSKLLAFYGGHFSHVFVYSSLMWQFISRRVVKTSASWHLFSDLLTKIKKACSSPLLSYTKSELNLWATKCYTVVAVGVNRWFSGLSQGFTRNYNLWLFCCVVDQFFNTTENAHYIKVCSK